jgi:hypothetical protein
MNEPNILVALRRKRDEIESVIAAYERKIEAAKHDLLAVNQVLRLYEIDGEPRDFPVCIDLSRLWKRGEIVTAARLLLEAEGPLDTRERSRSASSR